VQDRRLDGADVGYGCALRQVRPDFLGDLTACADRNADDDEVGARDRFRIGLTTSSAIPSSTTRLRVAADRAVATIERTAPRSRAARAIDEPIRPTPMSARRSKGADHTVDDQACDDQTFDDQTRALSRLLPQELS